MSDTLIEMRDALINRSEDMFPQAREFDNLYWAAALCGEAGEVANLIKKSHRDGHELDKKEVGKELADTLAYIIFLADQLDIDLTSAFVQKYNEISIRNGSAFRMVDSLGGTYHYKEKGVNVGPKREIEVKTIKHAKDCNGRCHAEGGCDCG